MRTRIILASIIATAVVVAWWLRWGCDDAYISYVYARDLVYGDGITWFGDHIEGYTNFLWVLWIAAGLLAGIDPLVWAWVGSLAATAVVLLVTFRIVRLRTGKDGIALFAVGMLSLNYTFLAFGTSGLETMLQCALLAISFFEVDRLRRGEPASPRRLAGLSVAASMALWTRLDSAVVLAVLGAVALHHLWTTKASRIQWLALVAPAVLLVGGWLAWKLAYYGDILPNTFHAKVAVSKTTLVAATKFVWRFVLSYGFLPVFVTVAVLAVLRRSFTARLPFAITLLWFAYVIFVGGDFMEFRFFVPVMPMLFAGIAEELAKPVLCAAALVWLLVFSYNHGKNFAGSEDAFYDSVAQLGNFYGKVHDNDWSKLGTPIGDVLADSGATIACNGAGAIPYFADLPTVDQLGLNDRWVARNGARSPNGAYTRPGHQRFATQEYLEERKVTFVIGSPVLLKRGILTEYGLSTGVLWWAERLLGPAPIHGQSITAVAAPVTEEKALLMWYLTKSPKIDAIIQNAGWEVHELVRHQ